MVSKKTKIGTKVKLSLSYAKWEMKNAHIIFSVDGIIEDFLPMYPALLTVEGHPPVGRVIGRGLYEDILKVEFKFKNNKKHWAHFDRKDLVYAK